MKAPNLKFLAEKARFGAAHAKRLAGFGPKPIEKDPARAERNANLARQSPGPTHFQSSYCKNCGADIATPNCGYCGQSQSKRLDWFAIGSEAWQSHRVFEMDMVKGALRTWYAPGLVAREFVLGARKRHIHPLKLLLTVIGLLWLITAQTSFFDSENQAANLIVEKIRSYGNWSFSVGILALVFSTQLVFRWRQPFNLTEHLVLGAYTYVVILSLSMLNQSPALVFRDPAFLAGHKIWSMWFLNGAAALVMMLACKQFFALDWRRDAWRLLLGAAVFIAGKLLLQHYYVVGIVKLVLAGAQR